MSQAVRAVQKLRSDFIFVRQGDDDYEYIVHCRHLSPGEINLIIRCLKANELCPIMFLDVEDNGKISKVSMETITVHAQALIANRTGYVFKVCRGDISKEKNNTLPDGFEFCSPLHLLGEYDRGKVKNAFDNHIECPLMKMTIAVTYTSAPHVLTATVIMK